MYESKLGYTERIEHVWDQLNGEAYPDPNEYGKPDRFYK